MFLSAGFGCGRAYAGMIARFQAFGLRERIPYSITFSISAARPLP